MWSVSLRTIAYKNHSHVFSLLKRRSQKSFTMCAKKLSEVDVEATVSHGQTASVADPYGELQRDLKQRHIQFIALGGTIGTGLFLGIGGALATSGPLSLFLGYSFTSIAIWCMVGLTDRDNYSSVLIHGRGKDAMPRRDDFNPALTRHDRPTRFSFRGSGPWICDWMEPMVQLCNRNLRRDLRRRGFHSALD